MTVKVVPRQLRGVYYGWYIVGAGFLANLVNVGAGSYLLGIMLVPMQEALHTSRTVITLALTVRQLVGALISPFVGPFADRKEGAKWVMATGGFLGGIGLILTGVVNASWQYLLTYGLLGGLGGLGSGFLVTSILLPKWFIRLRGRATAIANMGLSIGGLVMIPLGALLVSSLGWRGVWIIVGLIIWAVTLPVALWIIKTSPEDLGLAPDGDSPALMQARPDRGIVSAASEVQWTQAEALRTRTFWLLIVSFNLGGAAMYGIFLHQKAYLQEHGVTGGIATAAFWVFALGALLGKPFLGYLMDKISSHRLQVSLYVVEAIGIGLLLLVRDIPTAFLAALVFGLGVSGIETMQTVVWANYYGRSFQGSIRGIVRPFQLFSNAGGPVMAAWVHDVTNSYTIPFSLFAVCAVGAVIMAFLARPPVKRSPSAPV